MRIRLTQGKYATIDKEDYSIVAPYKWTYENGYAVHSIHSLNHCSKIWMHRLILNTPDGMMTDHINGNRADNRKKNLRVCTRSQNFCNRPFFKNKKYKGIDFKEGRWRTRIRINTKEIHIGYFLKKIDALFAYNEAARKYHGEFAYLNHLKK